MTKRLGDLVVVGVILGAHGVRGDVRVKSFTGEPEDLFDYGPFLDEQGNELLEPVALRLGKEHFIVSPAKPLQKETWDRMKGTKLCIPRSRLPETEEDEFYVEDLVGLDVFSGGTAPIGRIKAVLNHGAGDLIEVSVPDAAATVLIPFTREDVPVVDMTLRRIVVATFDVWADQTRPEDEPAEGQT